MKLSKIFSGFFGIFGVALMLAAAVLGFANREAAPKAGAVPKEAESCTQALVQALSEGDYLGAQAVLYGEPELGLSQAPEDETAAQVWEAVQASLSYSFSGECYSEGTAICRDLEVTYLDGAAVSDALPDMTREILEQRTTMEASAEIYDETGALRPEVAQSILRAAVAQAVAEGQMRTVSVKLQLIEEDGCWWVLPDRSLITAISGGIL